MLAASRSVTSSSWAAKYTDAFSVDVLGEDGKPVRLTMGSHGIGVSRLVVVIAEQQHDELGLRWLASVAPFDVHVVIANKDAEARAGAEALAADLTDSGTRSCSMTGRLRRGEVQDAELLGGAVDRGGRPGWADGTVELRNRFTGENRRSRRRTPRTSSRPNWRRPDYLLPPERLGDQPRRRAPAAPARGQHRALSQCRGPEFAVLFESVCSSTARQATAQSLSIRTASSRRCWRC